MAMNMSDKIRMFLVSLIVLIVFLVIMISVTIGYGFVAGSVIAVVLSLCSLFFIAVFDQPAKCNLCLFIKIFSGLSIINIMTSSFSSDSFTNYDSLKVTFIAIVPVLALVVIILSFMYVLFMRFNGGRLPRILRIILFPFMLISRPFRRLLLKIKTYDHACQVLTNAYNYSHDKYPPKKTCC